MINEGRTMREPAEVARSLSCWSGPVDPRPLSGGLSNHNFVVDDAGQRHVVRIGGDHVLHNVMRFNEHACGRAAEAAGITPRQLFWQPDALVMEFVDGETYDASDVMANLERILRQVRKLHVDGTRALRGPVLAFSPFHVARHYAKLLEEGASRVSRELPRLLEISAELELAAGPVDLVLCHNDLLAANFIDDGETVWIVDWEHAGFGSALFDLANIASNSNFDEALEHAMLNSYYGHAPDAALWRRFKALRTASHQREAMWSMVSEIHSDIDEDFVAYTDKNLVDFEAAYAKFRAL